MDLPSGTPARSRDRSRDAALLDDEKRRVRGRSKLERRRSRARRSRSSKGRSRSRSSSRRRQPSSSQRRHRSGAARKRRRSDSRSQRRRTRYRRSRSSSSSSVSSARDSQPRARCSRPRGSQKQSTHHQAKDQSSTRTAKLLENSHAWLGASTSSIAEHTGHSLKLKAPMWTHTQLQDAIQAVITQRMRFTQAATLYGIPKGTLYDNILGKSKRMAVLDEAGLTASEERAVLEFCCDTSVSPYNRRTKKSLSEVLAFVIKLKRSREPSFAFFGLTGFRWWWAFCKKHSIVSLFYKQVTKGKNSKIKSESGVEEESM